MGSSDLKSVLKQCKLFDGIDDTDLDILIYRGHMSFYSRGETIYARGEKAKDLFGVIISGRVGILAQNGQVIRGMGSAEVIGEIGVTSKQHVRTLSVEAIKPTELIEWDANAINDLVPDLIKRLKNLAWKNISNYMDT